MFPLEARIKQLEKKVKLLESSLIAAINTNSLLKKKSGQPLWSVLVKKLGFDQERVDSKIDKCHRLGKQNWKSNQPSFISKLALLEQQFMKSKKSSETRN